MIETVVNLLDDHRQAEQAIDLVKIEVIGFETGLLHVVIHHFPAGQHARAMGRLPAQHLERAFVVRLNPVGQAVPQIHQRITDGGHLPVQDADHLERVVRVQYYVVKAKIVVDHHLGNVLRHLVVEPAHHRLKITHILRAGLAEAITPAADLPLYVTCPPAQLVQARRPGIHPMQVHQLVNHVQAELAGVRLTELKTLRKILAQDDALQAFHHIEIATQNVVIITDGDDVGHVRIDRLQSLHHLCLTQHIVGRFGDLAKRGPTENVGMVSVIHLVGQVRGTAWVLANVRLACELRNGLFHEPVYGGYIQLFAFTDIHRLINLGHSGLSSCSCVGFRPWPYRPSCSSSACSPGASASQMPMAHGV